MVRENYDGIDEKIALRINPFSVAFLGPSLEVTSNGGMINNSLLDAALKLRDADVYRTLCDEMGIPTSIRDWGLDKKGHYIAIMGTPRGTRGVC